MAGCANFTDSYTSNAKLAETLIGPMQKKAMAYEGVYRNPIIIVHGFMGANLVDKKNGENIWGKFSTRDGYLLSDDKMRSLAIPMVKFKPLKEIKDDTVSTDALNIVEVNFLGLTFKENAYQNLIDILHEGGYQLEGQPLDPDKHFYNLFQFSYDWRRDLQENAVKLNEFINEKKKYILKDWVPFFYGPIPWNNIIQLRAAHMGITTDPAFKDNFLFLFCCVATDRHKYLLEEYHKKNQQKRVEISNKERLKQ